MKRGIAALGLILLFAAAVLFLAVFSGGSVAGFSLVGTSSEGSFLAFLFVIIALPLGAGLTFVGLSFRRPVFAAGAPTQVVYKGSSRVATAALAIAVIAIIIALAEFGVLYQSVGTASSNINTVSSQVSALGNKVGALATVNVAPITRLYRVDWCNTDNTGQDRYCPAVIVVNQGDNLVILFEHNDTDAHTFTMTTAATPYSFQINATYGSTVMTNINGTTYTNGMHDFLNNANYTGSCLQGTYAQESANLSSTYCVSGSSLLSPIPFVGTFNPIPSMPLNASAPAGGLIFLNDTNSVFFDTIGPGGTNGLAYAYNGNVTAETWGIGAFKANTPGVYEFFCHYHVSNGMFGYLVVLPNAYCNSSASACNVTTTSTT